LLIRLRKKLTKLHVHYRLQLISSMLRKRRPVRLQKELKKQLQEKLCRKQN
jgi:hypothetical protein